MSEKDLENTVRFYEQRGDCECPELEELWDQMKSVDDAQANAQNYAEDYVRDPKKYEKDPTFMRALAIRTDTFRSELRVYHGVFETKALDGSIVFKIDESEVDPRKLSEGDQYSFYCRSCDTEIPFLSYPGWGE